MPTPFAECLSSRWTFFYKFLFPTLWIGGFTSATATMWVETWRGLGGPGTPADLRWTFLAVSLVGSGFVYWACARLKKVHMDAQFIYISNFSTEIQVPLTQVARVTENLWDNTHPVTVHFTQATPFGEKITFMPRTRLFGFWSSHPVVARIRTAAHLADEF